MDIPFKVTVKQKSQIFYNFHFIELQKDAFEQLCRIYQTDVKLKILLIEKIINIVLLIFKESFIIFNHCITLLKSKSVVSLDFPNLYQRITNMCQHNYLSILILFNYLIISY